MNAPASNKTGYYAFISYSHKDIQRVRKLHRKIELFATPKMLHKLSKKLPKRVFPVFRDETDLAGTSLTPKIESALQCSDFLIVVCTKHSADSIWVKREIEAFRKHHSADCIIPVFFDYKTQKAFEKNLPDMLSGLETSMGNSVVYALGARKQALFDIVSRLLNCYSPQISERFKRRRDMLQIPAMMISFFLISVLYVDLNWIYKDHYDIQKYCRDISFSKEWPEAVGQLNPITRLFCDDYYVCTYHNNRIVRIQQVSEEPKSADLPGSFLLEADIMEFDYNNYWKSEARISRVVFRDSDDQVLFVKNHALSNHIVDLTLDLDDSNPYFLPANLENPHLMEAGDDKDYSCRIAQFYDDFGRITEVWFLSDTRSLQVCDSNGCYGFGYEYNDSGELITVHSLNKEGHILKTFRTTQ